MTYEAYRDKQGSIYISIEESGAELGNSLGDTLNNRRIQYDHFITNGKSVIAPGQPNDEVLSIRQAVIDASVQKGIELKGSWGTHMTVSRFTSESSLEAAAKIVGLIGATSTIGMSRPTSIDVGYLAASRDGFTYTTYERFPLDRE